MLGRRGREDRYPILQWAAVPPVGVLRSSNCRLSNGPFPIQGSTALWPTVFVSWEMYTCMQEKRSGLSPERKAHV